MAPESREPPSARELARRLIDREASRGAAPIHATAERATQRVYEELARWIGANGSEALFSRALVHARDEHTALRDVRIGAAQRPVLEGIAESTQLHGPAAVEAGLESLLVAVLELLGRLIGADMTARLMEQVGNDDAPEQRAGETSKRGATT